MRATTLARFLASGTPTGQLMAQAQHLVELRRLAAGVLPAELWRSATIANAKQGKVVIFAENAAIAAKLRLFEPALMETFARAGCQVTGLRVVVQVPDRRAAPPPDKRARIAPSAAASLERIAKSLPESELRTVVARLARRARCAAP